MKQRIAKLKARRSKFQNIVIYLSKILLLCLLYIIIFIVVIHYQSKFGIITKCFFLKKYAPKQHSFRFFFFFKYSKNSNIEI